MPAFVNLRTVSRPIDKEDKYQKILTCITTVFLANISITFNNTSYTKIEKPKLVCNVHNFLTMLRKFFKSIVQLRKILVA